MKILINYDYMNAVKNVNENLTPFKVIRNNKYKWLKTYFPLYLALDLYTLKDNINAIIGSLLVQFGLVSTIEFAVNKAAIADLFAIKSELNLKDLVDQFSKADIETSFDLIKKSELYSKKYDIRLNEKQLPELVQSKYILVPTYDHLGDVKKTSIVQEHVMGSKDYVLSLGRAKKVLNPAFSNI